MWSRARNPLGSAESVRWGINNRASTTMCGVISSFLTNVRSGAYLACRMRSKGRRRIACAWMAGAASITISVARDQAALVDPMYPLYMFMEDGWRCAVISQA